MESYHTIHRTRRSDKIYLHVKNYDKYLNYMKYPHNLSNVTSYPSI